MVAELKKLYERLNAAREKAREGDKVARKDKEKIMSEIRNTERQLAREGKPVSVSADGDSVRITLGECDTKRSLQEEYVRRFDAATPVRINNREQTLREYHRRRLFGK